MLVLLLLLLRGFEMPLELWFRLLWTEAATDEVNCSRAEAAVVGDVVEELLPPFLPPFVYEARSRAALQASMDDQPFMLTIWSRYSKTLDRDVGSLNYARREDLLRKLFWIFTTSQIFEVESRRRCLWKRKRTSQSMLSRSLLMDKESEGNYILFRVNSNFGVSLELHFELHHHRCMACSLINNNNWGATRIRETAKNWKSRS